MLSCAIDAHGVRELEAVDALADFADVVPVLIELEQAGVAAARVDEDVALRVGGDADAFAEIEVGRQLEEVGHRRMGMTGTFSAFALVWAKATKGQTLASERFDAGPALET